LAWWIACLAAVACSVSSAAVSAAGSSGPALRVCLEEGSPPYSFKFKRRQGGFDLVLAERVAKELGRTLAVQWFEFEIDEDEINSLQANALLADGRCELIGGFPMLKSWLAPPGHERSGLPDLAGARRSHRGRTVQLGLLAATRPYRRTDFGVVAAPGFDRPVRSLDDLKGVTLIEPWRSVPAFILWRHRHGAFIDQISHVAGREDLFEKLEATPGAASLIEVHRFDRYRFQHPGTRLRWTGYVHRLGYNFGFAALAGAKRLVAEVDRALERLETAGALVAIAKENGVTYFKPQAPIVSEGLVLD